MRKGMRRASGERLEGVTRRLNGEVTPHQGVLDDHIYDELRAIVAGQLKRESGGLTGRGTDLNVTSVCHDVWLKLRAGPRWDSRDHYYGSAIRATRRLLIDAARRRKRRSMNQLGDAADQIAAKLSREQAEWLDAMDGLIRRCEAATPGQGRAVELWVFGGLDTDHIASILGVSRRAVQRYLWNARTEWRRIWGVEVP